MFEQISGSRVLRWGQGLLCTLALTACEADLPHLPEEPLPEALSANFLLQHGGLPPDFQAPSGQPTPADRIYGFLGRVSSPTEVYLRPVFDASASINGVPLQVRRRPEEAWYDGTSRPLESEYNYFTDSLSLSPGTQYTLTIEQGGQRLQATTRMPGDYRLVAINGQPGGARVPRGQPLILTWTRAEGAAVYAVTVESPPGAPALGIVPRLPYLTSDTAAVLPFTYAGTGTVPIVVEIRAMDTNLYRASAHNDARAGIEGGYGFFGSVTVKRHRIDLQVN